MKVISSSDEFKKIIAKGISVVDFNAPWCAPCHQQEPILVEVAKKFEGKAEIACMNVEENKETALKLRIQSIPTLIVFKNGKEIQRFIGLQSEKTISSALENI